MADPTDRGAPEPWPLVMRELRAVAADQGWTGRRICKEILGCRPKDLSNWSDPDGPWRRAPPMWAVRRLADVFGLAIVVLPDEVLLVPRRDLRL